MFLNFRHIITLCILFALVSTEFGVIDRSLTYLKYTTLLLLPLLLYKSDYKIKSIYGKNKVILAFLIVVFSIAFQPWKISNIGFYNFIIILSSIIPFFFLNRIGHLLFHNFKLLNLALLIPLGLLIYHNKVISINFSIIDFLNSSTSNLESNMLPFLVGFFLLYWIRKKNKFFIAFNIILMIMVFKRIVFVGIIGALLCDIIRSKKLIQGKTIGFMMIVLTLIATYLLQSLEFASYIYREVGIPIGHLTKGRSTFLIELRPYLFQNYTEVLFGIGQGNLVILLDKILGYHSLIHNDILKLLVEHGIIVFILFFYFLFSVKNEKLIYAYYFTFLLFTDNVLIYSPVVLTLLLFSLDKEYYSINSIIQKNKFEEVLK